MSTIFLILQIIIAKSKEIPKKILGIYDYDATGSDEISFKAGDKIKILNRVPNGVEDGWWKGKDCFFLAKFKAFIKH